MFPLASGTRGMVRSLREHTLDIRRAGSIPIPMPTPTPRDFGGTLEVGEGPSALPLNKPAIRNQRPETEAPPGATLTMLHSLALLSQILVVLLSLSLAMYVGRTTYYVERTRTLVLVAVLVCLAVPLRRFIPARPALAAVLGSALFIAGCTGIWLKFYLTKTTHGDAELIGQPGVEAVYLFQAEAARTGEDRLELDSHPREVRADAGERFLYVTHGIGGGPQRKEVMNSVVRVNLSDPSDRTAIRGGTSRAVAVNRDSGEVYTGMWAENAMLVLDGTDFSVKKRIPTNPRPWNFLVDYEEEGLILMCEWEVSSKCSSIEVFDLEAGLEKIGGKEIKRICAYDMVKSRGDGRLFISSWFPGTILALDGKDFRILHKRTLSLVVFGLALDEATRTLYVAIPVMAKVAALDMDTMKIKYFIKTEFSCRNLALDKESDRLYVGGWINGILDVIDLTSRRSVGKLYLGRRLRGISLSDDRRTLYAVSQNGVFKVDLETALAARTP